MRRNLIRTFALSFLVASILPALPALASNCANTSTGQVPLTDLGAGSYFGFQGGLYPGGSNFRPAAHESAGIAIGQSVTRLDLQGEPHPQGRIVFISIGMSNCFLEYSAFKNFADGYPTANFGIEYLNCAQGGQTAEIISNPNAAYWNYVDSRLWNNDITPEQVQVIWFKNANQNPTGGFPGQALSYQKQVGTIMHILHDKFPNLKQVYLSSRIYGGYASIPLNPEPYAYESGFGVKWLIEAQIAGVDSLNFDPAQGPVRAPWMTWGPYLWADGMNPRSDGLTWACSQFDTIDGTHPNPAAQSVVAQIMLDYFLNDPTSMPWFFTAVSGVPGTPGGAVLRVAPNPARANALISWDASKSISEISIFDLAGRKLRTLQAGSQSASARWDLRDEAGRPVPGGIYWARPNVAGPVRSVRIVVQRD